MTTEQKIKALAELDGYSEVSDNGTAYVKDMVENWEKHRHDCIVSEEREGMLIVNVLRYLTSYDAILPLIQKQNIGIRIAVASQIRSLGLAVGTAYNATPEQLADALLRATGRWEG